MTAELLQYKTEGFCIAKGLLDKDSLDTITQSLTQTLKDQLKLLSAPLSEEGIFPALKALHTTDIERYKKVVAALWRKEAVFNLMHSVRITGFLREKFGWDDFFLPGGQVVHIMASELKIPNGYFGLVPHQDFPSVQGSLDGVVVWVPLVKVTRENFPLEIFPGSHKQGVLPMVSHGTSTWEVDPRKVDTSKFVPVEVDVGDVVFMSVFTVHRSSQIGAEGSYRIAMSTRFDNANEPTFIERAYPTAYIRSVHREQYQQDFPTPHQIETVFSTPQKNNH